MDKQKLRPVIVSDRGKKLKGFFHRYIYQSDKYYSTTQVLVELEDGRLKTYEPEYVQFADRKETGKSEDGLIDRS
uniref:hypothetical protein n=1 Tax=Fulvivirga sp. TaxID=1931237 RepID=UPI00404A9332